jgi:thioesterase domain-containing protein
VEQGQNDRFVEILTSVWQQVLDRPSIGIEADFFALGGNPYLASKLFTEISKVFGRELPAVTIYQTRTIAALAILLQNLAPRRFPPVVLLKEGTDKLPVFFAHGLGGSLLDFFELLRHIHTPHTIYGLQAKGIDGVDEPFKRIEDMAQYHLEAIKELQPCGPYLLVGYSLGGLVTLEIARRLVEYGEKVALLGMLDSYPHKRFLSLKQRLRLLAQRAKHRIAVVGQWPIREARPHLTRRSGPARNLSQDRADPKGRTITIGSPCASVLQRVEDCAYLALTRYQPRFYPGRIRFVRAQVSTEFPNNPAAVWASLSNNFEVESVSGDHLEMLTLYFAELALVVSRYLGEAISRE